jgi:hypothetical protein
MAMGNNQLPKRPSRSRKPTRAEREKAALQAGLADGTIIPVDRARIFSHSAMPRPLAYYRDTPFNCRDCGVEEVWTAMQQQRWYEQQGGEIEAIAIHCRVCRRRRKEVRAINQQIQCEALVRKQDTPQPGDTGPGAGA